MYSQEIHHGKSKKQKMLKSARELPFQIGIHLIVFLFFSISMRDQKVDAYEVPFFFNYALTVAVINYFLLPRYFYKKRYGVFVILLVLVIGMTVCVEEFILESIYFPDTKGKQFGGVFFSIGEVLPVVFILSSFKYGWDTVNKIGQIEEMKDSLMESEMKFLISQINPHFLFNNLNNLYSYALSKSHKTPEIILELSTVLRYMLYNCKTKFVPIANELKHIENFTKLNELQIEERGTVYINLPKEINSKYKIAPLILIVFIENAFKHSICSQMSNIIITIEVELTDTGILSFMCTNSFEKESREYQTSKGIGLENVKKRLDYLYKGKYELSIQDAENIFAIGLNLDLNS